LVKTKNIHLTFEKLGTHRQQVPDNKQGLQMRAQQKRLFGRVFIAIHTRSYGE
jgi:hypothetical protein